MFVSQNSSYRLSRGYLLLSLVYMGWLFYLSSLQGGSTGPNTPVWRLVSNLSHIALFGGLGFCLAMTFKQWLWKFRTVGTLGVGFAYALFDEYHQAFVPGRSMSGLDIGLDLIGLVAALWMLWLFAPIQQLSIPLKKG